MPNLPIQRCTSLHLHARYSFSFGIPRFISIIVYFPSLPQLPGRSGGPRFQGWSRQGMAALTVFSVVCSSEAVARPSPRSPRLKLSEDQMHNYVYSLAAPEPRGARVSDSCLFRITAHIRPRRTPVVGLSSCFPFTSSAFFYLSERCAYMNTILYLFPICCQGGGGEITLRLVAQSLGLHSVRLTARHHWPFPDRSDMYLKLKYPLELLTPSNMFVGN